MTKATKTTKTATKKTRLTGEIKALSDHFDFMAEAEAVFRMSKRAPRKKSKTV